jgi:hypothetical protein
VCVRARVLRDDTFSTCGVNLGEPNFFLLWRSVKTQIDSIQPKVNSCCLVGVK